MSVQPEAVINTPLRSPRYQAEPAAMSLRSHPEASGARNYVGDGQEITVEFTSGYTPGTATAFTVAMDHDPTDASPRSGIKVASGVDGGCNVWEVHDAAHSWSRETVYFAANKAGITQKWLIL